jgi:transcriptional regulator with XRE-family HTH domain
MFALQTVGEIDTMAKPAYTNEMTKSRDRDALYTTIGQRIREWRAARGLTQAELAALLSMARTSLTNIENGRQKLLVHTLLDIAAVLDVDAASLLPNRNRPQDSLLSEKLLTGFSDVDRRLVTDLVMSKVAEDGP